MAVATRIVRFLVLLLGLASPALAQDEQDLLHYQYDPPLDTDIVHAFEIVSTVIVGEIEHVERWTHDVVIRLDEKDGEEFTGTFELRNVVNLENAEEDFQYLVARSLEGEPFALRMLDLGLASEVDWPAIEARLEERIPELIEPAKADIVLASLDLIPDKTKVVLRPIDAIGQAYVFPFRKDGELHRLENAGKLTYLALDPAVIEIGGGFDQEPQAYILDWLVTPQSDLALEALEAELQRLANTLGSQLDGDSTSIIDQAVAEGINAAEDGYAIYDLDRGLVQEATITALIGSDAVAYGTRIKMTLTSP
ncbi:hypothetical protein [Devosia sediminis]|uniref:DUF4403 family protein n=1 Tax=Devosia sediminis TaxID=2798801 RepID=A0A934ML95_9HYPH|nr:hypothetical protein [Devosia sediminis]MBJ3784920.1 hypothetical protein [Devosia sediminis]